MSIYKLTIIIYDEKSNRKSASFLKKSEKRLDDFSFDAVKAIRETISNLEAKE